MWENESGKLGADFGLADKCKLIDDDILRSAKSQHDVMFGVGWSRARACVFHVARVFARTELGVLPAVGMTVKRGAKAKRTCGRNAAVRTQRRRCLRAKCPRRVSSVGNAMAGDMSRRSAPKRSVAAIRISQGDLG